MFENIDKFTNGDYHKIDKPSNAKIKKNGMNIQS
jgi:hypothetical protein